MKNCENCGGAGEFFVDKCSPAREHYTVSMPCPDCNGSGEADDAALDTVHEIRRELTGPIRRLELGPARPGEPWSSCAAQDLGPRRDWGA